MLTDAHIDTGKVMWAHEYHSGSGFSRSQLMDIINYSPLHFWYNHVREDRIDVPPPEIITVRNAKEFGNAFHTYVLEPDLFDMQYYIWHGIPRNTNAGKDAWKELLADKDDQLVLDVNAYKIIRAMAASINGYDLAKGLIEGGTYERSFFWTDPDTGIPCKIRPDIIHSGFVADIKTAACARPKDFARDVVAFGYHIQAAMIHECFWNLFKINMVNFHYVVIEKEPPYAIGLYPLDETALLQGIYEFKESLFKLRKCLDTDVWPQYAPQIVTLPNYAINRERG